MLGSARAASVLAALGRRLPGLAGVRDLTANSHVQTLDGNCDPAIGGQIVKNVIKGAPAADYRKIDLNQELAKTTGASLEQAYALRKLEFSVVVYSKAGDLVSDPIQPGNNDGAVTTCQHDQLAECFTRGSGSFWVGNMVSYDGIRRSAMIFFHRQGEAVFSPDVVSAFQSSAAACLGAVPTVMDTVAGCFNSQNAGNRGVIVTPVIVSNSAYVRSQFGIWGANHVLVCEREFVGLERSAGNKIVAVMLPAST